jgi:hypothetical protein
VNDFLNGQSNGSKQVYVALLDSNGMLHNPPITNDTFINYTYHAPGPAGTIAINAPPGWTGDQNTNLDVSITYQSGGGGSQTPTWAYRIDSPFPGYGSPHGGTQVTGPTSVNNFLSGQPNGSKHVYVALLDQNGNLHNPPVVDDTFITYTYQTPGGGSSGTIAINAPPMISTSTTTLSVLENASAGGLIGNLYATDPDANDSLSFSLVNGGADSAFAIDANGSVRTTHSLDFELQPIHQLFFRASDNHGAFSEGNLTILVIDVSQPITETMAATAVTSISANLQGSVIDDGGGPVTNYGFLISTKPHLDSDLNGTSPLFAVGESANFSAVATNLQGGKKYFYRAFATNTEGTSLGSVETFTTTAYPLSPSWVDAKPGTANNWWTSPWFGNFYLNANGWTRHEKLGWVFPMESPSAGLWLWKQGMGWLWTDREIYPFLYDNRGGGWLYFFGQHEGTKLFYDYLRKKWTTLKEY